MTQTVSALAQALLAALSTKQRARLRALCAGDGQVSAEDLLAIPPLEPLCDGARLRPGVLAAIARAAPGGGNQRLRQITDHCAAGQFDQALALLGAEGGAFLAMTRGIGAAQTVAAGFPEDLRAQHLIIGLLDTVNALKLGDMAKADALLGQLGAHHRVPTLAGCTPGDDSALICVLFMKAVYEDSPVPDAALEMLFAVLSALPTDAALLRGLLYNVGLDVMLRKQRLAEASEAAQRALFHYHAAAEPGLGFYIRLYMALMCIWQGDLDQAAARLDDAARDLDTFDGSTANDGLLLRYFRLILDYERGAPEPLVQHVSGDAATIPFGELWPAMAEPILGYARRALACHVTPAAALSWVRRWRLKQWRSQRFDQLISVQEAAALQDMGRWQEADEVLAHVPPGSPDLEMIQLASALERTPGSDSLGRQLRAASHSADLPLRQELTLRLMAAQSAVGQGNEREAARHLGAAMHRAGPAQLPMFWREQRPRLEQLRRHRPLREALRRLPQLRRTLDDVTGAHTAPSHGLTRQEHRVLLLLAEGLPNKHIAQRLGVALPTVKFHVRNLCRKTGASSRRAAVDHALAQGWLA